MHDEGDEGKKDGDQREGRSGKRQQQDQYTSGGREREEEKLPLSYESLNDSQK